MIFFVPDDGGRRGHSKDGVDWIFKKNSLLAIELLITGTVLQITVLAANQIKAHL